MHKSKFFLAYFSLRGRRDRSRAQSFGLVEEKKPRGEWGGDALKSLLPED